ncbi:hypothetical protein L9F63_012172, partial [Diploptera punctata]
CLWIDNKIVVPYHIRVLYDEINGLGFCHIIYDILNAVPLSLYRTDLEVRR